MEILSAHSAVEKNIRRALPYLPVFPFKPNYILLRLLNRPEKNFRKWDSLGLRTPLYGYFSVDAHLLYRPLLSLLNLFVLMDRPVSENFPTARDQVFDALRLGRFYNAVNGAAAAGGFRFYALRETRRFEMGEESLHGGDVTLHVDAPLNRPRTIRLIHNGLPIRQTDTEVLRHIVRDIGVYRVEVYLKGSSPLAENVPWIVSNPIFIRKQP
jgi:hypothetical protein